MKQIYSSLLAHWLPRPLAALGLLGLLATAGAASAQAPTFAPVAAYASGGTHPYGLATGDVDGDGRPDLVTLNASSYTVAVLLGSATTPGTFGAPTTYPSGGTRNAISVTLGDVNGDSRLDVVATNSDNNTVGVLLNSATTPGTFGPVTTYSTGSATGPRVVALGDVNGDGRLDIATASFSAGFLSILLNSATTPGTFGAPANYSTGGSITTGIALGDLNGDGRLDALTLDRPTGNVAVFLNPAATPGTFGTPALYSNATSGNNPYGLTVGDLNGDNRLDVVTANFDSPTVSVLLNSATTPGTLRAATTYSSGGNTPIEVAVSDMNGDGRADIVVSNFNSDQVGVLLNSATTPGTFVAPVTFSTGAGTTPRALVLADLNADGRRDIATANFDANTIGVLLNTSVFAAPTLTSLNPTSGPVGTSVTLTGTNLSSATAVSFNGTATVFTIVNATTITMTVPTGATSGPVTVTTASGTTSGILFTVTYPDLVVNTTTTIPAGTYNSITVTSTGSGTLAGNVTVNTSTLITSGGTLQDGCSVISGTGSFTLAAGGTLGICAAQGITRSSASGAVQVTGTRSFSTDASYMYNGSAAQVTGDGLPSQIRNLTATNANPVTLSAPTSATQVVTVNSTGNLVLNGQALTLLSSSAGTALVVNASAGRVVGNTVVVQRYIDGSLNSGAGYRHYSVPVTGATVADFTTSGFTPVVNPAYNTSPTPGTVRPFPTFYLYNQNRLASASNNLSNFDKGWFSPSDLTYLLYPGFGYTVNIDAGQVVDFVGGLVSTPSTTIFLERTTGATAADGGWVLLGNPYASPLDLSLVAAADRHNVEAATYVIQSTGPYAGGYRAYVNGVSTSASNSPLLALGQGFFVRVSAGQTSGTFTFRNAQRVTTYASQAAFQRTTADMRPTVRVELAGAGRADTWVAYAEAGATPGFDGAFDAGKLPNTTGLNLSSVAGTDNLAIDGRSTFTTATTLPLAVGVPAAGTYTLTAAALDNLPTGLTAYLRDAQTGQTTKLTVGTSYDFRVRAAEAQALVVSRFTIIFSPQMALATMPSLSVEAVSVYPNPAHSSFAVTMPGVTGASAVQAELVNTLGQVVRRQSASLPASGTSFNVPTAELAAGVYVLRLQAGDTTLTKRVVVQ